MFKMILGYWNTVAPKVGDLVLGTCFVKQYFVSFLAMQAPYSERVSWFRYIHYLISVCNCYNIFASSIGKIAVCDFSIS